MSELKSRLSDASLLKTDSYVDGRWVSGETAFAVTNPADRQQIAEVADVGETGARKAVAAAHEAFAKWKKTSVFERARLVMAWHDLIMEHVGDLGTIITAEMGKPLKEARGEVAYGAGFVKVSAEEATRLHGETLPVQFPGARGWTIRQPVGVVACITPWNFPSAMILSLIHI